MKKMILSLLLAAVTIGVNICEMDKITFMVVQFILLFLYAIWLQKVDEKEFLNKKNEMTFWRFFLVLISRMVAIAALSVNVFAAFTMLGVGVVSIIFLLLTVILAGSTIKAIFLYVGESDNDEEDWPWGIINKKGLLYKRSRPFLLG